MVAKKKKYKRKRTGRRRFKIKKKKSLLKDKWFWILFFGFLSFGGLIYLFLFADIFQVKNIKIIGNQTIATEELLKIIEPETEKEIVFETRSIFLINLKKIEEEILKSFPQIESVFLKKRLPALLIAEIKEKQSFAVIRSSSGKTFYVDEKGIAFREEKEIGNFVIDFKDEKEIVLGQKIIEPNYLESIFKIRQGLEKRLDMEIKRLLFFDEQLNVLTGQGFEIYFDLENNAEDQIFNLELIGREKIKPEDLKNLEYIDLRFGNKVFYK